MRIQRYRGDTYPDEITITNRRTAQVVNLTGCSFKMTVGTLPKPPDSTTQLYQLTGVVTNPTSGVVSFAPTAVQANLVGIYFYDIEMTDSYNQKITLDSDEYVYIQDITK